jgi:pimeloyl-ACP methyl ester carboxylesterase
LGYEYLGEHTVKNIEKAVRVYRVLSEPEPRHMEQEIRFCATPDGVRIAHSTVGQGPAVVIVPGWISHLQLYAELPAVRALWEKMARNHTLVAYDKHGCGLSERSRTDFSLESELRPLEAVVEHLKLRRFALWGISQSGAVAAAYAAGHPRRVSHLILYGAYARGEAIAADELKVGLKSLIKAHWGMGSKTLADLFLPGVDEASIRWFVRLQREAATPEMAAQLMDQTYSLNVVDVLPKVRVPTLVMHRRGDRAIPFHLGREMAAMIPGARFVQLEGSIHLPFFGDVDSIGSTMAEFLGDPLHVTPLEQDKTG